MDVNLCFESRSELRDSVLYIYKGMITSDQNMVIQLDRGVSKKLMIYRTYSIQKNHHDLQNNSDIFITSTGLPLMRIYQNGIHPLLPI